MRNTCPRCHERACICTCEVCHDVFMREVSGGIGNVTADGRLWCGCDLNRSRPDTAAGEGVDNRVTANRAEHLRRVKNEGMAPTE